MSYRRLAKYWTGFRRSVFETEAGGSETMLGLGATRFVSFLWRSDDWDIREKMQIL